MSKQNLLQRYSGEFWKCLFRNFTQVSLPTVLYYELHCLERFECRIFGAVSVVDLSIPLDTSPSKWLC
jgi:hypothetical protein